MDATGRYVAFVSNGTNLVTNSLVGEYQAYVKDLLTGVTTLVNRDTNGIGPSVSPSSVLRLSADGRFIAFESHDGNLVPNDRNHALDIFLRDATGDQVELISVRQPALPSASGNGLSSLSSFSVSSDGRYAAFSSEADNLVANDTNGLRDIFVRDLFASTNVLVSVATNGTLSDGPSSEPAISGDGRYAAFTSSADNLVPYDTNRSSDVFVRDLQSGVTILVSPNTTGSGTANGASYAPNISRDGRYVLFRSQGKNLASGTFAGENLFLRDLTASITYALTTNGVLAAAMTPEGRYVAFNAGSTLYVWDSQTASPIFTRSAIAMVAIAISPDSRKIAYLGGNVLSAIDRFVLTTWTIGTQVSAAPRAGLRFSADSRFLVYAGSSGYTNSQIFLFDFQTGTNTLISGSFDGLGAGNGNSDSPDLSADGRFVVYRSFATNLVAASDSAGLPDLFLYDRSLGTTALLTSSRYYGGPADNRSLSPVFSGDGRTLLLQSWASDLVSQDFNQGSDVLALNFLYATIVPGTPGQSPTLTWPARPCETYRVQLKNGLGETNWQEASGIITITGNRAQFTDAAPGARQRFYRIVAF